MSMLDELFEPRADVPPPEARRWELLSQGRPLVCELLRRRNGLSWEPARIQVSVPDASPPVIDLPVPWERRLDDWLLAHKAVAISPQNEAERFGFRFDSLFEPIEEKYGDGYFNAILVKYVDEKFGSQPSVREKLDAVHAYPPAATKVARECWEQIEQIVAQSAQTLTGSLGYKRPGAEALLSDAIAYYLDDRFNISMRKLLGFSR
jgi:hypothetical protein